MRVGVAEQFAGALRRGVRRDWLSNRIVFAERNFRVDAVDGGRRAEDELLDVVLPCELQQVQRSVDIGFVVKLRLVKRRSNARSCCEMNDAVEVVVREGLFQCFAISYAVFCQYVKWCF